MKCFAALVVLLVYPVHSLTLPDGVVLQCPATYQLSTPGGEKNQKIIVNVTENKKACDNARKKLGKTAAPSNETLETFVKAVFKQEYQAYHAEITWSYTVTDEDLPMKFLLNLAFYKKRDSNKYKKLNSTCLQVSLEGHQEVQKNERVKFHFDCVPLLKQKNIYLVTEVLSLPGMSGPRCLTKRSNPDSETSCNNGILCSKRMSFPISERFHRYRQCVCHVKNYGYPKLQWSINQQSQRINININNLPPYLENVDVDIVEKDKDGKEINFETFSFSQNKIQKEKVVLELVYQDPGRYAVYVCCATVKIDMMCDDRNAEVSKTETETECGYKNLYFFTFNETINDPAADGVSSTSITTPTSLGYILGIVGAIVVVGVVTLATFLLCRCRNTASSGTNLPATYGENCEGNITSIEEIEPIELTDFYASNISAVQDRPQSPNNEQETCVDRIQALQNQVLMLYHTTSDIEFNRVVRLKEFLEGGSIFVKCMTEKQLQGFPEALKEIVLIFQQIPHGHCHYLQPDDCSEDHPFIEPDNSDPAVYELLEKTAKLVLEGPDPPNKGCDEVLNNDRLEHNSINLHLVSFNSECRNVQDSVMAFLRDYNLMKGNVFPYYLLGDNLNLKENSDVLLSLVERIKGSFPNCINRKIREINSSTLEL